MAISSASAQVLGSYQQTAHDSLCSTTPSSQLNDFNWVVYEQIDEMTDEKAYWLFSKTIRMRNGASVYLEVTSTDLYVSADRPLDRNEDLQIGVRIDEGPYHHAMRVIPHQNRKPRFLKLYSAIGLYERGLITREQLHNYARTGNFDGTVPEPGEPPRSLRIAVDQNGFKDLVYEMKKGTELKLRIQFHGEEDLYILRFSLMGFTRAYQSFEACLKRLDGG